MKVVLRTPAGSGVVSGSLHSQIPASLTRRARVQGAKRWMLGSLSTRTRSASCEDSRRNRPRRLTQWKSELWLADSPVPFLEQAIYFVHQASLDLGPDEEAESLRDEVCPGDADRLVVDLDEDVGRNDRGNVDDAINNHHVCALKRQASQRPITVTPARRVKAAPCGRGSEP